MKSSDTQTIVVEANGPITISGAGIVITSPDGNGSPEPSLPNSSKFSETAYENRANALLFSGKMNKEQEKSLKMFLIAMTIANFAFRKVHIEYLAYMLATAYWETAQTMEPIEEYGKGAGRPYGEPDPETGRTYYGRGYVQLTWRYNYESASKKIYDTEFDAGGVDLVNYPDLALKEFYAAQITLFGMLEGWFTGKKLDDYWRSDNTFDYVQARRIINGTDKAQVIAGYAIEFESAIRLALGQKIERDVVQYDSHGDDVRELQLALSLTPDGKFGPATETAVKQFQAAYGLNDDGIVGKKTWDQIEVAFY